MTEPEEWSDNPDEWPHTPPLDVYRALGAKDSNLVWRMGSGHVVNLLDAAIEQIDALAAEVKRLRRWKDEASEALIGLQDLGKALGILPGQRITGEGAAEAARVIVTESGQLRAAVERVRAEANAYAEQPEVLEPCGAVAQVILAALDGDDGKGEA